MSARQIELDLHETGFLCDMITTTYMSTNPPRSEAGNVIMPAWLHALYVKLATINDQMMDELPKEATPPQIILPNRIKRH